MCSIQQSHHWQSHHWQQFHHQTHCQAHPRKPAAAGAHPLRAWVIVSIIAFAVGQQVALFHHDHHGLESNPAGYHHCWRAQSSATALCHEEGKGWNLKWVLRGSVIVEVLTWCIHAHVHIRTHIYTHNKYMHPLRLIHTQPASVAWVSIILCNSNKWSFQQNYSTISYEDYFSIKATSINTFK